MFNLHDRAATKCPHKTKLKSNVLLTEDENAPLPFNNLDDTRDYLSSDGSEDVFSSNEASTSMNITGMYEQICERSGLMFINMCSKPVIFLLYGPATITKLR